MGGSARKREAGVEKVNRVRLGAVRESDYQDQAGKRRSRCREEKRTRQLRSSSGRGVRKIANLVE
jgi:hypothetical protein